MMIVEQLTANLWCKAVDHHDGCGFVGLGVAAVDEGILENGGEIQCGRHTVAIEEADEVSLLLLSLAAP